MAPLCWSANTCVCGGSEDNSIKLRLSLLFGSGLRRNIASAALQSIIAMFAVFGTYRIVIDAIGIEVFGLWSVLLAGAAIARVADVGGGSGLARFVAECDAGKRPTIGAVAFVHTTFLSTLGLMLAGSLLLYILSSPLIWYFAPGSADKIIGLVPAALLVSVLLPPMSALVCSALDGTQRVDLRAALMSLSYVVLFATAWTLVGQFGIYGFAAALATQHVFLIVSAWLVLRLVMPGLGWVPRHWSSPAFRESFGFGLRVQATAFAGLLSDPLARILIASAGGVAAAGHYELALKLMQQLRSVFVAAMQPLVPQVAALSHDDSHVRYLIIRAVRLAAVAGIVFTAAAAVVAPIYAHVMVKPFSEDIVIYTIMLGAGYGVNLITVPLFFGGIARGVMRWNLGSQFVMAACIGIIGGLSAVGLGGIGVISGQLVGLVAGAAMVGIGNANVLNVAKDLRGQSLLLLGAIAAIGGIAGLGLWIFAG